MTLTLPKCDHPCLPAVQFDTVAHLVRAAARARGAGRARARRWVL